MSFEIIIIHTLILSMFLSKQESLRFSIFVPMYMTRRKAEGVDLLY